MRIIIGMVSEPTVTVLAIDEPEIIPKRPDAKIETFAGPPENRPAAAVARSIKRRPRPMRVASTPNST
jgi:hypothetical protein